MDKPKYTGTCEGCIYHEDEIYCSHPDAYLSNDDFWNSDISECHTSRSEKVIRMPITPDYAI